MKQREKAGSGRVRQYLVERVENRITQERKSARKERDRNRFSRTKQQLSLGPIVVLRRFS